MNDDFDEQAWDEVNKIFTERFGYGEELEMDGMLYLIGLRELGVAPKKFKKDEKLDIMHIAICRLLSPYGYYRLIGLDEDGWPHYEKLENLPYLKAGEQSILMKTAIIRYFREEGMY